MLFIYFVSCGPQHIILSWFSGIDSNIAIPVSNVNTVNPNDKITIFRASDWFKFDKKKNNLKKLK